MLDPTHTIMEVSIEDWEAIIHAIHYKYNLLQQSRFDCHISDELKELNERELKQLENIESRIKTRFIIPCTLPGSDE